MPIYNLIEYSGNYLQTSVFLWQCYRDVPVSGSNGAVTNFTEAYATTSSFNPIERHKLQWHKICWNNGTIKISK